MTKMTFKGLVLSTVVAGTLASLPLLAQAQPSNSTTTPATTHATPVLTLPDFTSVVDKTEKAVVNVRTLSNAPVQPNIDGNDFFRFFFDPNFDPFSQQGDDGDQSPFGMMPPFPGQQAPHYHQHKQPQRPQRLVPRSLGSGFIISKDGYIITNYHVIAGAKKIIVSLLDGKEYTAKVVGSDKRSDIALLKVKANDLPVLKIGDSDKLKKGQWVLAIGSPFDLDSTVTAGIVSAINRDAGEYLPFIQTDVAVNPGNSGGPLLNLNGEVVGVNSQIISRSGGYMGISLAIPIDDVMRIVDQLKDKGHVTRGQIGVQIAPVNDDVAKAMGLQETNGTAVLRVEPDSPAAKAGLKAGDIILSFNGQKVKKFDDLPRIVGRTKPGTVAKVVVWRLGKELTLDVRVKAVNSDGSSTDNASKKDSTAVSKHSPIGFDVKGLTDSQMKKYGVTGGVQITDVTDNAFSQGLKVGDIVLAIGNHNIKDVKDFNEVVKKLAKNKTTALLIQRRNTTIWQTYQLSNEDNNAKHKKDQDGDDE